jgi:predicted deacetylase
MAMDHVIFDLDDFAQQPDRNCLDALIPLKEKFPNLKVTLFAIPFYENKDQSDFFHQVIKDHGDWIELGIHGWDHRSNFECMEWTYKEANQKITDAWNMGCFTKVFKAPGWQISRDTYSVCKNAGFVVADHKESVYTEPGVLNKDRRPKHLRVYEIDHPWMVHGHTWNCVGNGIYELVEKWEKEGYPWDENTQFHSILEIA